MRLIPNLLTLTRIVLAPVLVYLVILHMYQEGTDLVVLAAMTDWLDGYAARKLRVSGQTGVVLDPAADKILLIALFFALWWVGLIPNWLAALTVIRDLVIVGGSLLLRQLRNVRTFRPSMVGKVSTFFQIVYVLLVLLYAAYPHWILQWLKMTALVLTAVFTAWSGFGYVRLGIRLEKQTRPAAAATA